MNSGNTLMAHVIGKRLNLNIKMHAFCDKMITGQPVLETVDSAWLVPSAAADHTNCEYSLHHEHQNSIVSATDLSDV